MFFHCRYDKVVIDGRRAAEVISPEHAEGINLYALGHMVNHGGLDKVRVVALGAWAWRLRALTDAGCLTGFLLVSCVRVCQDGVNVLTVAYDFPQDPLGFTAFPENLRPYIPNRYIKPRCVPYRQAGRRLL